MSRSKHTRPSQIIAADRIRAPKQKRGEGDKSSAQKLGIFLKELGINSDQSAQLQTASATADEVTDLPQISAQRPRRGFIHPADKSLIRQTLLHFGELSFYGVREICLVHNPHPVDGSKLIFGRLAIPGKILLYEQPQPPWLLPGSLPVEQRELLKSAGALIELSSDGARCKVDWPDDTLIQFMLFEVLMHEVGHHIIQQFKGKREAQVLRRKDHEALALSFARRCRQSYHDSLDRPVQ